MKNVLAAAAMLVASAGAASQAAEQQESPVWQTRAPATSQPAASQPATTDPSAGLPREELEKILGPIALYPDVLLAQILPASTFPLDIVQAARWLRAKPDMTKLQDQPWDPSVLALCNYPEVLYKMDEDLDWTNALGAAFLDQQKDVMATIQDLRSHARASGALKSTPEQNVSTEQGAIVIAPAQPEVIYVPQYDPQVVYAAPPTQTIVVDDDDDDDAWAAVAAGAISFGAGLAMGAWLNTDCDWYGRGVVWCQPGHWHGYVHGGAAWGPNRVAAWGPNRAMIAGPNGGAYFGPRGAAAWGGGGGGAAWARPTPYGRPSYTGRYASYNTAGNRYSQVNRGAVRAGNTVNVNRNNVNIDRGNRASVSGGTRANVVTGDRTSIGAGNRTGVGTGARAGPAGGNRAVAQPASRQGATSAFSGGERPSQTRQYSQRGSQSRGASAAARPSGTAGQARIGTGGASARPSSFSSSAGRTPSQSFSSRGSASRGGGAARSGGGRGGGGRGGGRR